MTPQTASAGIIHALSWSTNRAMWIDFIRFGWDRTRHCARFESKRIFAVHISCKGLQDLKASLNLDFRAGIETLWGL